MFGQGNTYINCFSLTRLLEWIFTNCERTSNCHFWLALTSFLTKATATGYSGNMHYSQFVCLQYPVWLTKQPNGFRFFWAWIRIRIRIRMNECESTGFFSFHQVLPRESELQILRPCHRRKLLCLWAKWIWCTYAITHIGDYHWNEIERLNIFGIKLNLKYS